jgi:hypothetical protein
MTFDRPIAPADSIAAGLKSNRAREAFMLHASKNGNRFSARVMEHVAQQTEKAREQSIAARITTAQNLASTDPTRINESLGKIRIALAEEIKRQGLTPQKHKDEIAVMETAAMGQAVLGAFNTLAGREDFEGAKALLEDRDIKRWLGDKTDEVDRTLKHMEVKALATPLGQKAFDARSFQDLYQAVNAVVTPEQAAQRLVTAATEGGKGNIALMRTAHAALRPDEWGDVASLALRSMGTPVASARGITQEVGFSVSTFMTRWEKMDPRARQLLFGNAEHAQAVDDLVRTVRRLSNVEAMTNTSRSASNAMGIGGIMAAGGAIASGADAGMTMLGTAMAGAGASLLLSRPSYARWTAQYARIRARALAQPQRVNANLVTHINQLGKLADADPELQPVYQAIRAENQLTDRKDKPQTEQRPSGVIGRP